MTKLPKFTPLSNNVLVLQVEEMEMIGDLYIPQGAQEKPHRGEVLAVGPGRRLPDGGLSDMNVTAGDVVLFGKYSGQEIKLDNTSYLIMSEDDILGIVEP